MHTAAIFLRMDAGDEGRAAMQRRYDQAEGKDAVRSRFVQFRKTAAEEFLKNMNHLIRYGAGVQRGTEKYRFHNALFPATESGSLSQQSRAVCGLETFQKLLVPVRTGMGYDVSGVFQPQRLQYGTVLFRGGINAVGKPEPQKPFIQGRVRQLPDPHEEILKRTIIIIAVNRSDDTVQIEVCRSFRCEGKKIRSKIIVSGRVPYDVFRSSFFGF